ncbi:hypothetical protein [Shimia sp. NS0008-38b]|uniref:hypothetical protein n=1 Tax=Shimia sp. NS0008-38b TaxID=3127653 RepID=UPI00333FA6AB
MMSLNFGQDSPRDHYDQLVTAIDRLRKEPQEASLGQQAAICVWSLCDWVSKHPSVVGQFANEKKASRSVIDDAKQDCPELVLLRAVANAKKHRTLNDKHPKISKTEINGGFSRAFSNGFKQAGLYVEDDQGQRYLLDDLLEAARKYWDQKLTSLGL